MRLVVVIVALVAGSVGSLLGAQTGFPPGVGTSSDPLSPIVHVPDDLRPPLPSGPRAARVALAGIADEAARFRRADGGRLSADHEALVARHLSDWRARYAAMR